MKKLILLAALYCLLPGLYASTIKSSAYDKTPVDASERAKAHFKANYGDAADASWYKLDNNNNMYCIFHQGKAVERVFYNNRGSWQYTLSSYPASALDNSLRDLVLNSYESYRISYVNEIRSEFNEPVYIINIENDYYIKVIKVVGDDIELQQSLNKG